MAYQIGAYRRMAKDLANIPNPIRTAVIQHIDALAENPRMQGAERMHGFRPAQRYRIRVGDYRVVYDIDDQAQRILIVLLGHRRDVYQALRRL